MEIRAGRKYWIVVTALIVLFSIVVVGRNAVHAVKIKRQIGALHREMALYRERIARDSLLLEQLRYDDYLEEFARERFRMQRRDEQVFLLEE